MTLAPPARLRHRRTAKGLPLVEFTDSQGQPCSLADSAFGHERVWLGVDGVPRMMLDRATVAALLPLLAGFVERGSIREDGDRR